MNVPDFGYEAARNVFEVFAASSGVPNVHKKRDTTLLTTDNSQMTATQFYVAGSSTVDNDNTELQSITSQKITLDVEAFMTLSISDSECADVSDVLVNISVFILRRHRRFLLIEALFFQRSHAFELQNR